ncbi:MAG: hypothetical protein JSV26_00795 [bacterium]|nr:MAG: hypothetical protein JSV26_00795 [bacterium]
MEKIRPIFLLLPIALVCILAPSAGFALPVCAECHGEWLESAKVRKVLHPPFEEDDCVSCHDDHGDDGRLVLVEEGTALCFQCHDEPAEGSGIHPVIEDEGCLGCHDPHGSASRPLLTEPAEDLCLGCHDDVMAGAARHEAALDGGCTDCHSPHASRHAKLLLSEPPNLCLDCHDDPTAEGRVHAAVEDEGCLFCHGPHSSENRRLLTEPAEDLCLGCHDDVMAGAVRHEAALDGGCTDCHSPHASGHAKLLLSKVPDLCTDCHEVVGPLDSHLHTALADGGCTDCHLPHAAGRPKLLTGAYNMERFPDGFSEGMYELCFQCHDPSLVTGKGDQGVTNFRNGPKNLHDVHVQGQLVPNKYGIVKRGKARSCSVCHDPHGSSQPFDLIREYSCQGVFCFTMTYHPLEDGGRCMVGCHKPQSYHRSGSGAGDRSAEISGQPVDQKPD